MVVEVALVTGSMAAAVVAPTPTTSSKLGRPSTTEEGGTSSILISRSRLCLVEARFPVLLSTATCR